MESWQGDEWRNFSEEAREHLNRQALAGHIHPDEKQVFFVHEKGELLVTPLADTLPLELARRIAKRKSDGELFRELGWKVGGTQPQNSGVMAATTAGKLPKIMALPPGRWCDNFALPDPVPGRFLTIELDVHGMNATGAGIAGGIANITGLMGFLDALRRKTPGLRCNEAAIGYSRVQFLGEYTEVRHMYAVPIVSLAKWVKAEESAEERIFWRTKWLNAFRAAMGVGSK